MKRKGFGLRVKFAFFVMILVVAVVLMAAVPLGYYMMDSQERTLAEGLEKRVAVLLESLATGARAYLPSSNTLELGLLVDQISAMDEALFATITGPETGGAGFDAVWATNDPGIEEKTGEEGIVPGRTLIHDAVAEKVPELSERINGTAAREIADIAAELDSLTAEALRLAVRTDEESRKTLAELQITIQSLDARLNETLSRISSVIASEPSFESGELDRSKRFYTFYKPVVYRTRGEDTYYRGMIRLGVSTENILREIDQSRDYIIRITGVTTLASVILGLLGSLLLASLTVIPIKRLVRGVEVIRDTDDKADLKSHVINVKTRDELSVLANTVNQMTQGLVKAAQASRELTVGKEVQKMFIPLEKDGSGKKLTTGREETEHVEFFGYYEGAKGVSGDYFDFTRLDDRHYAIIKCDVAGKGVSASLIMVEVATIFLSHFREWSMKKQGLDLTGLVYRMNDLLEERGFKGRFAALTVAILDAFTGKCYICNAGDTLIHLYDSARNKMVQKELPKAPAAGVFPSMLVEMQSPYKQFIQTLKAGDTLFLFTDGLEEAKRNFRDASYRAVVCKEAGLSEGELHDNHPVGSGDEEFGIPRIQEVAEAVFHRSTFTLTRHHNPDPDERLEFDFSGCNGTVADAVLALVSVEKVFRLIPDPSATKEDRVQVDMKIDDFLKTSFRQYSRFFSHPVEASEPSEYVYFSGLREDEQYDDLTILGIKMKEK